MKLAIRHTTTYRYDAPVVNAIQTLRLTPRDDGHQRILQWDLTLPGRAEQQLDAYGNVTHLLRLDKPQPEIRIEVHGVAETFDDSDALCVEPVSPLIFLRPTRLTAMDTNLTHFADSFSQALQHDRSSGLSHLAAAIATHLAFSDSPGNDTTTAAEAFKQQRGPSQDHAHIFLAICRYFKIPARYVSGYRYLGAADQTQIASHAWAEAWIHDQGWQGFDIAYGQAIGPCHLKLAVGMDYLDACPIRGLRTGGGHETLEIDVAVQQMAQ